MKKHIKWILVYILISAGVLLTVHCGSRTVSVISERIPIERKHCIIIDAGHGGLDGGATSCSGILESAYNLNISLRLNDLFHFLGYDTKMTRMTDKSIYTKGETIAQKKISDLKERVKIVNETDNGLLISIHQNNFSNERYHGAQVFYSKGAGSEELAKCLQSSFTTTINPGSNRLSKRCEGIYLMDHIEKTGVLIECGFLSNVEEEAKLRDPDYQKKLSCVIAAAISTFLSNT